MTPRQKQTLDFIRSYTGRQGYAPTLREIGQHLGCSHITAYEHTRALIEAGHLAYDRYKSRSFTVLTPTTADVVAKLDRCIGLSGNKVAATLRDVRRTVLAMTPIEHAKVETAVRQ
jgi:SOS-response transcriptional repressor LexA